MKKIIISLAFLVGTALASCGHATKTTVYTVETVTEEVDTTFVRVLTVYGDTVAVDTIL